MPKDIVDEVNEVVLLVNTTCKQKNVAIASLALVHVLEHALVVDDTFKPEVNQLKALKTKLENYITFNYLKENYNPELN